MTVEENLELGALPFRAVDLRAQRLSIYGLFPRLGERRRQRRHAVGRRAPDGRRWRGR